MYGEGERRERERRERKKESRERKVGTDKPPVLSCSEIRMPSVQQSRAS
jgi:hypothetical protein